nr:hypothetical protein [Tanacetum cinerariifolium]
MTRISRHGLGWTPPNSTISCISVYPSQELEAHYMYMAQIQEVTPDAADNSGPIFDYEPMQKVSNNDNYNVFAIKSEHTEQSKSVNDTYPIEQDEHNVIIDSLDMRYDREQVDQDDDDDLVNERDLLASLIKKQKYEIDDSKNQSSNNHFKEANNELSKTNKLMYKDLKKFQAELDRYNDVKYVSKVEIDCAKAKEDLMSYKMKSKKSFNAYTRKINDLNQTISEIKKELFAHQETISIMSQQKESHIKFYKTREDKEIDKVIALENKVKVLDNIVYKTDQSVQTMNMLNRNCKTSFAKPEFLKKAQRANPRLYDIGCYNDNLALMLAPESNEVIRLEKESRSKISDSIRPFDYEKLNNLYDLFVPQREKSSAQRYFSERIDADLEKFHLCLKEKMVADFRYFNSLELKVDSLKSQLETQKTQFLNEIDRISREYYYADHMNAILGVYTELDEVTNLQYLKAQLQDKGIAISELKKLIEKLKGKYVENKFEKSPVIRQSNAFKSQRPSILGKPTIFLDSLKKKDCSKSKSVTKNNVSNDFSKPATTQILPSNNKSILKNTNVLAQRMYKLHTAPIQTRTTQLPYDFRKTNKRMSFSTGVILPTSVSRPQLKSNQIEDRVMLNNSQGKKHEVEDHRRNVKFSKNKTSVTACNDILNAKTSNVNFVCVTCGKCVLNDKHDKCVLHYLNDVNSRTKMPMAVPISTREPKRIVNQSVAKPLRRTIALESTNQKPRHTTRKLYEYVSKRTRVIVETIHVKFDELPQMASDHVSSDLVPECPMTALEHDSISLGPRCQENVPQAAGTVTTSNELDLLFSPMFDELLNGSTQVVSKYSAVTSANAPNQCQQQHTTPLNTQTTPEPTCQVQTQAPTVTSTENINQAETITENAQVEDDEFINIFCTPLESDDEMCMFALTFLNEIDRLSREYYYVDHMNAILGVYTELDEVTNLQCDYLEMLENVNVLKKSFQRDAKVSLVLRIDNTLPLVENTDSEATEVAWTLTISMVMQDRTGNIVSFDFQKSKTSKVSNSIVSNSFFYLFLTLL